MKTLSPSKISLTCIGVPKIGIPKIGAKFAEQKGELIPIYFKWDDDSYLLFDNGDKVVAGYTRASK